MRRRRRARERQEKKEVRRPILKKLCATLLRSFRGQHGEKNGLCEGISRGNWDPREDQQSFGPNPRDRGPHQHVEAAVDWCSVHSVVDSHHRCCSI